MKKIVFLIISICLLLFAGCGNDKSSLNCEEHANQESWKEDCNTCTCNNGKIECTKIACVKENNSETSDNSTLDNIFKEELKAWKYNSNLTEFEQAWLSYLEIEYPNSRIIFMKSDVYSCEGCYDLYYKKDREIIKIKVQAGDLQQESTIKDDIIPLIENEHICSLFGGTWNDCPAPCATDEEACTTMCNPPVCELDGEVTYNAEGEECGGLDKGDCEYGLFCYYVDDNDEYGTCQYP